MAASTCSILDPGSGRGRPTHSSDLDRQRSLRPPVCSASFAGRRHAPPTAQLQPDAPGVPPAHADRPGKPRLPGALLALAPDEIPRQADAPPSTIAGPIALLTERIARELLNWLAPVIEDIRKVDIDD